MKELPLISIIVPVYKVEKYLAQCIDSIIAQSYRNIEIIIIDDGSPDNCGKICDTYSEKDSRISVIHQENGGLSKARNTGIDNSHGRYLSFIDSDDFVSPYFIEILYDGIRKTGAWIASTDYKINRFSDGNEKEVHFAKNVNDYTLCDLSVHDALELMLYQSIPSGAQYRLYKREVFDNIRFPEGWIFEDVATVYRTFIASNRIALCKTSIYAYRVRNDGIVKSKFTQAKMVVVPITQNVYQDVVEYDSSLRLAVASRAFAQNYHVFLQVPANDTADQIAIWNEMKKYRSLVLQDKNTLVRTKNKVGAISAFLGRRIAWRLGHIYLKLR